MIVSRMLASAHQSQTVSPRRRPLLLISLAASLFISIPTPARSQDVVTGLAAGATVGIGLNLLMDKISTLIEQAKNAGLTLEMEAGRQVYLGLQSAQNAYRESLNLTLDRADQSVRTALSQFNSMVNDVQSNTFGNLDVLTRRVQTSVNSLPFRPHQPQVASIRPNFVAPLGGANGVVSLRYAGNFEFASRREFRPKLMVGNSTQAVLSSNTTQDLSFSVPAAVLRARNSATANKVAFVPAVLEVPWTETRLGGIRRIRRTDTYKTLIGVLPQSPGDIRIVHYVPRQITDEQVFTSPEYTQCSLDECANMDRIDVPYSVSPDAGWTVVRNTSTLSARWREGDHSWSFVSDDGKAVRYNVTTVHKQIGTSGKVIFTISFRESKTRTETDSTIEVINDRTTTGLRWGDQITRPYVTGSYKILFTAFDGSHTEFTGVDDTNKFLKVRDRNGRLVLATANPTTLVFP
jgi:hypothetical protein